MIKFYFLHTPELGLYTLLESDIDSQGRRIVLYARPDGSEGLCLARSIVIIME